MRIFKKEKRESKTETEKVKVKVQDVFLVETEIVSNYNDGSDAGPKCATMYFLATKNDDKYYELFSKRLIKEKKSKDGFMTMTFNTPFIEKIEPLKDYLANPEEKELEKDMLFDFIVYHNTLFQIGALKNSN